MSKPTGPSRKLTEQEKQPPKPWLPAAYDIADVAAVQALQRGDATPDQMQRALRWIIETCAGTYDMSFRPGDGGSRETDFAEGKRHVGNQIIKLSKINTAILRKDQTS